MLVLHGHRLIETTAGTILCPDWIPNRFVIYIYDMQSRCYALANHVYAHLRAEHTGKAKAFFAARTGGPDANDDVTVMSPFEKCENWCGEVDTFSPFVYGDIQRYQMISGKNNPDLDMSTRSPISSESQTLTPIATRCHQRQCCPITTGRGLIGGTLTQAKKGMAKPDA